MGIIVLRQLFRRLWIVLFSILVINIGIWEEDSFAEPAIKITLPQNGDVVYPRDQITVVIEVVDGFRPESGMVIVSDFFAEEITSLPASFDVTVPLETIGTIGIAVVAQDERDNAVYDQIEVVVGQAAALQSLEVEPDEIILKTDWSGNIAGYYRPYISVTGIYSDGVKRSITTHGTTFTSNNPSVISVDSEGKIQVHKAGETVIAIFNSGISVDIPVTLEEPSGVRPEETLSPTTQIDIQPLANSAGWHNSDVTATINASDNEDGSGVKQIIYQLNSLGMELNFVSADQTVVYMSEEGYDRLRCWAVDNEGNSSVSYDKEFHIDKTPPQTAYSLDSSSGEDGWIHELPVTVSFSATDNLSGIAFTTDDVTINEEGIHEIEYYSKDVAGNIEATKTLTVKIKLEQEDITPPEITLKLEPVKWWFLRFHKLIYSATDDDAGVKEIKAGLVSPDISNYKTKLKKDRRLGIIIDEEKKYLVIKASNPQEILNQLKAGLLLIDNNQLLHLKEKSKYKTWKISNMGRFLIIRVPEIVFKTEAEDNAGNTSTKELEYKETPIR